MNDKLMSKAVECYIEKLEKENALLRKIYRRFYNIFGSNAKGRTEKELLDDVLEIIMYYGDAFKEESTDEWRHQKKRFYKHNRINLR